MTAGLIEVLDGGIGNSIQDAGRFGFRHMGITVSGGMDNYLARCANALAGNSIDCACLEIRAAGPKLLILQGPVRVALAGDISAVVNFSNGESQALAAWQSITLGAQDELEIAYLSGGTAYLAVSGGITTPPQLGSRSTYQRALIGGLDGQPLMTGNLLPSVATNPQVIADYAADPWLYADDPVRVMLGPQEGHFQPQSVAQFLDSDFQVTTQLDRMGVRLEGSPLQHISPAAADIVSDGVTPGTIQVPGNGHPIILLADCQTVGGYPKIATVITADAPRLGQFRPGQKVRFAAVSAAQAKQALLEREAQWASWASSVRLGLRDITTFYNDICSEWMSEE